MNRPENYKVASSPMIIENDLLHVLFAGESQTKPAHRLGPKVYDFYLMHVVLEGSGIFICGDNRYELQAGHTFLIEPEQLVSYESDVQNPWRYRWVAFRGALAGGLLETAGLSAAQPVVDTGSSKRPAVLFHHIFHIFRSNEAAAHLKASGYLQLLLAEYSAVMSDAARGKALMADEEGEQLLQKMIHYLSTQYAHPVSIEQMAEALGYNRAYLSRFFKRKTGTTPVTFLLKLRIDKARQMLRERGELTIEQISASVGLQDALYFSKQFRRFYNQSPTAYREAMRSQKE
ncbi:AraC family transcriptional regulator [Paenibacillus sp. Leaf72]|uniref:AraC family transcriptional regulator n=1 Tax=Paenibacillus sp. Leaf72 TaxID=1736234 RepID=UPI0006F93FDA|nr:AraC family transcriptional regulator [Paenibacillus sp. Leaf72]KQN96137.1 AraC family transcriptional regulator [Paenibacillus sp. Leaf72]